MEPYIFRNWSGRICSRAHSLTRPSSVEELAAVVRKCAEAGRGVRAVGSGHSFTELVPTDGTIISLDDFQGIEQVDRAGCTALVRGGTKLRRLNRLLEAEGLAMENLGDIDKQSMAGAISTGTHGAGIHWRILADQAAALTLVTAAGETLEIAEDGDPELFKAAQVSLGALGVIAKVKLRLLPLYNLRYERKRVSFEECAQRVVEFRQGHRHFEFYWFPYTETVQLKFLDETEAPPDSGRIVKFLSDVILENALFGLLCRTSRAFPGFCKTACGLCGRFVAEGVEINRAYQVLATSRLVRFNEMEYGVPADAGIEVLREIDRWIRKHDIAVCFPLEFRFVRGDDIHLSPAYGRDSAFIAVHMYVGMDYKKYFEGIERIFLAYDGRPHWGKMHTLDATQLASQYPKWDEFQAIRRKLDPQGLFLNPYLRRLFG
jgi:FAD-linked oxidoreductase